MFNEIMDISLECNDCQKMVKLDDSVAVFLKGETEHNRLVIGVCCQCSKKDEYETNHKQMYHNLISEVNIIKNENNNN